MLVGDPAGAVTQTFPSNGKLASSLDGNVWFYDAQMDAVRSADGTQTVDLASTRIGSLDGFAFFASTQSNVWLVTGGHLFVL